MDEDFAGFLEEFGPPIEKRHVPVSSIERYRGKLPDQLLTYWAEQGWCGYADGLFWTVESPYSDARPASMADQPGASVSSASVGYALTISACGQ